MPGAGGRDCCGYRISLRGDRDVLASRALAAARPWEYTETTGAGVTLEDIVAQEADAFQGGETSLGGGGGGGRDEGQGAQAGGSV